jgi:NTP pyrophosphatase (non-canonical NTP hydrolase)
MAGSKLRLPQNPTLADVQQYVIYMEKERGFSGIGVTEQALLLVEEVGELCKVIRKHHTSMGIDVNKQYDFDAAGEIADVLIMLTAVANRLDIDIERAFREKEEQNKQRTWK